VALPHGLLTYCGQRHTRGLSTAGRRLVLAGGPEIATGSACVQTQVTKRPARPAFSPDCAPQV
jgi:hypothetical protein